MTDDFKPVWIDLHKHVDERTRAVLMVHYFGQPQDIGKYISFCEKYNLSLIEDNAHGHSGKLNNQSLLNYGRVILNIIYLHTFSRRTNSARPFIVIH